MSNNGPSFPRSNESSPLLTRSTPPRPRKVIDTNPRFLWRRISENRLPDISDNNLAAIQAVLDSNQIQSFTEVFETLNLGLIKAYVAQHMDEINLPVDRKGNTPLLKAVKNKLSFDIIQLLLTYPIDITLGNHRGKTPLQIAQAQSNWPIIILFIAQPAYCWQIDKPIDTLGNTPLLKAIALNLCIEPWLVAGANINTPNLNGDYPLLKVIAAGQLTNLELLLAKPQLNIWVTDETNNTVLHKIASLADEHAPLTGLMLDAVFAALNRQAKLTYSVNHQLRVTHWINRVNHQNQTAIEVAMLQLTQSPQYKSRFIMSLINQGADLKRLAALSEPLLDKVSQSDSLQQILLELLKTQISVIQANRRHTATINWEESNYFINLYKSVDYLATHHPSKIIDAKTMQLLNQPNTGSVSKMGK